MVNWWIPELVFHSSPPEPWRLRRRRRRHHQDRDYVPTHLWDWAVVVSSSRRNKLPNSLIVGLLGNYHVRDTVLKLCICDGFAVWNYTNTWRKNHVCNQKQSSRDLIAPAFLVSVKWKTYCSTCLEIVAIRCRNFIFWNVFLGDGCHLAEILFWHLFWDENPRKMCYDDLEKEKSVLVAISSSNILLSIWGFFFKCFSWWKSNLYFKSLASC